MKYGILSYQTFNIGDEIQSIAAKRFLPKIDYYFDRDNIDNTKITKPTKLILNGWYIDHPENWPPSSSYLHPLLISIYIEQFLNKKIKESFLSEQSLSFLRKNGPVGARDLSTLEFLRKNDIDAYFSGCLTLTIKKDPRIKRQDFILAVGLPPKIIDNIKKKTKRQILTFDSLHNKNLSTEERFAIAKYYLFLYQSAHAVVTTRLHCMLPCLALNTPVIALTEKEPHRYNGLIQLANHCSIHDFIEHSYDLESPPPNPSSYLELRENLIKKTTSFTQYDSKTSFLDNTTLNSFLQNPNLLSALAKSVSYSGATQIKNIDLLNKINNVIHEYETDIEAQKNTIAKLRQSQEELLKNLRLSENPGIKTSLKNLRQATINKIRQH